MSTTSTTAPTSSKTRGTTRSRSRDDLSRSTDVSSERRTTGGADSERGQDHAIVPAGPEPQEGASQRAPGLQEALSSKREEPKQEAKKVEKKADEGASPGVLFECCDPLYFMGGSERAAAPKPSERESERKPDSKDAAEKPSAMEPVTKPDTRESEQKAPEQAERKEEVPPVDKSKTKSKPEKIRTKPSKTRSSEETKRSDEKKPEPPKVIKGRMTGALMFAVFSVTLGSFQFGYNIGCINAPGDMITEWIIESHKSLFGNKLEKDVADVIWSVIVSAFPVGGAVGGIVSGVLADKAGRKGGLLYTNILSFIAAALMGISKNVNCYPTMIAGRFFIGIYAGLCILVPIYLTEVSPTNLRGMIASLHQLVLTIAILFSQIVGLPQIFGTPSRWPFIFWFIMVPALLQVICLQCVPESPKYTLCMRGNAKKATKDLEKLRGTTNVQDEVDMMRDEAASAKGAAAKKPSMGDMFRGSLRWPMTIAIVLMLTQQLSGINAVMFYSTVIFKTAGLTAEGAVYATIAMGTVNVLMTVVSVWLVDHPKAGRRALLIIGLIGMWLTTVLLVVCISLAMGGEKWASYGAIAFVLLYVISFATGAGSIPWFFVSEIFASNARGNANAIAIMTNWVANVVVGLTFLPLNNVIKQYSILVFTVCITFSLIFVWKYVPETKGKTTEEITAEFEKKKKSGSTTDSKKKKGSSERSRRKKGSSERSRSKGKKGSSERSRRKVKKGSSERSRSKGKKGSSERSRRKGKKGSSERSKRKRSKGKASSERSRSR